MGDGALASLPAHVFSLGGDGWRPGPINPPDSRGQRAVAKGFTGDLSQYPNEALPSLGFFPGFSVGVGLAKLLREGPKVRVRVMAVWAKVEGLVASVLALYGPDRVATLPGPQANSATCLGASVPVPAPLLLQGAASCDVLAPASPDCPSPPQGTGPGHRRHCSPRSQSVDLHHERLPLRQGEDAAVLL